MSNHKPSLREIRAIPEWCLLALVRIYRYLLSPYLGVHCRFYPSCSHYAEQAIKTHGAFRGSYLSVARLLRCHPWHPGGIDLVPEKDKKSPWIT